jgi:hypothetical protein
VTAVNVYTEVFGHIPHTDSRALAHTASQEARRLTALSTPGGGILVVEPGVPRSGQFIACMRDALLTQGSPPRAPCTHTGPCPFPGGRTAGGREKQKWCHLAFDTQDAPSALLELSVAAGLPKERTAVSFVLAGPPSPSGQGAAEMPVRILSDPFPLPADGRYGRYGCSEKGAVLVVGDKGKVDAGTVLWTPLPVPGKERRDPKTGALVVEVKG